MSKQRAALIALRPLDTCRSRGLQRGTNYGKAAMSGVTKLRRASTENNLVGE